MKNCYVLLSAALVVLACSVANASVETIPLISPTGADSGWNVSLDTASTSIVVDLVNFNLDIMVIQISKEFTVPKNPFTGMFPPIILDFIQRLPDAGTVGTIVIADETITNQTGWVWEDYHWQVMNDGEVWFDIEASTTFGIQDEPHFQSQYWHTVAGEAGKADGLTVYNGEVADGTSYFPGIENGDLVMRIDLSSERYLSFTFKQFPTEDGYVPEPATAAIIGVGLAVMGIKRIVRRRAA